MQTLDEGEIRVLYALLFCGDTFTTEDYYAAKTQENARGAMLHSKKAIEWASPSRRTNNLMRISDAGKEFLKQHSEKGGATC